MANHFILPYLSEDTDLFDPWADKLVKPKPKRHRIRKPTLTSVAKQVMKAGLDVARYEIDEHGKIIVVTGTPITTKDTGIKTNANEWN